MKTIVQEKIVRDGWLCSNGKFTVYWKIRFRFEGESEFNGISYEYDNQRSAYRDLKAHRKGLNRFLTVRCYHTKPNYTWLCVKEK